MASQAFIEAQQRMLDRYGVAAESRYVDVPAVGGRAHVLVAGSGPAVMLVPGAGTPAAMWAPLMAHLHGFTLYGVDLPGFGLTDGAPALIVEHRQNAVCFGSQVLDGLGLERAAWVGNSLGARWTSWLALDEPDRVSAQVWLGCPAVLLGTSAPLPMRLLSVRGLSRVLMKLQPPSTKQAQGMMRMVGEDPSDQPELVDLLVAHATLPNSERMFLSVLHDLLRLRGARAQKAISAAELAATTQSVQFIWGEDDPFGSQEAARRAASLLRRCEFHVVGGGHAPWLSQSHRIAPLVAAFLRGVAAETA